jgi:hypothetical protein
MLIAENMKKINIAVLFFVHFSVYQAVIFA